ncbi:cytidine deaminase [Asticcacaulis sp. AC460]|uniref:cytidine deaminase n=1 Tax=Asticcacaulis sp. AC460 TaxID=1282360 RepID=UPI0003C3D5FE|nr:cytidine deaminase [Asticcacaulis sp. AC460]ESQ87114.1 cytidine deaminase [Asticcacaulis sp. AC460]
MSQDLFEAARAAMQHSHSPYSKFKVGAALRDENGRIHAGCNIENVAFPEGICAEATAIAHLIMAGRRHITEAAVIAERLPLVAPCGGCRQKLSEFASPQTRVWLCDDAGPQKAFTLAELLPAAFGTDSLA